MKKNLILGLMSLVVFLFTSCKTEVTKRADFKEVMQVHDEAMARMGEIHDMKKQVESWAETASDSTFITVSYDIIKKLEMADEGMMSWMAEFKIPDGGPENEMKSYFAAEQIKVDKVSEDIDRAINNALKFLEDHK
ncbi:MAG: hypothetical protein HKN68_02390 [Saprospiraceae bacterium]|nr:hypothetical protein [Saprospiraceae bacterium]